ncbi:MAG: c-type cytochrome [Pirellulales bacterium]|nr:c-type cytochrome [Pirellulales bacterium]
MKRFASATVTFVCLASIAPLLGCGKVPPPQFRENVVLVAAKNLSSERENQIGDILVALFGTPDEPFAPPEAGLDLQKITMAAGSVRSDSTGAKRGLFREHCAHCHGLTGDGMGPTAAFLNPYPRDYRQGWFKFKSTASNYPPTHDDLMRTLRDGITGTAMPSFKLLSDDQLEALVEYVKYLSVRGQTEIALIDAAADLSGDEPLPETQQFLIGDMLIGNSDDYPAPGPVSKWSSAVKQVTQISKPPADFGTRASIDAGKKIFYSNGGCVKCHGPTALGDGQQVPDLWNKDIEELQKKVHDGWAALEKPDESLEQLEGEALEKAEDQRAEQRDQLQTLSTAIANSALPLRISEPRNLRQGIFRGGREPFELFYRLHNGIYPAQMPAIAPQVSNDDIWHVIDYVLALPYEPGSQYAPEMSAPPRDRL